MDGEEISNESGSGATAASAPPAAANSSNPAPPNASASAGPAAAAPAAGGASSSAPPASNPGGGAQGAGSFGNRVLHNILGALGGTDTAVVGKDADGNPVISKVQAGPGTQFKRILAAALQGAAAGASVRPGPGNQGRAAAAGVQAGLGQAQREQDKSDEQVQRSRQAMLFKANMAKSNLEIAFDHFRMQSAGIAQDDKLAHNQNTMAQLVASDPANREVGVFKSVEDFNAAAHQHQELAQLMASGQLQLARLSDGLHVYEIHPGYDQARTDEPVTLNYVTGIGQDGQLTTRTETIPAGGISHGKLRELQTANDAKGAGLLEKYRESQATLQRERESQAAQTQREGMRESGENARAAQREAGENARAAQREAGENQRTGAKATQAAAKDAEKARAALAPAKADLGYVNRYLQKKERTGAGDEALIEKFFDLARPEKGFRMTQPQIDLLQKARGITGTMQAKFLHATKGTWLTEQQRHEIVGTMKDIVAAKEDESGGAVAGGGPAAGGSNFFEQHGGKAIGAQPAAQPQAQPEP